MDESGPAGPKKVPTAAEIASAKESYKSCSCPDTTELVCGGMRRGGSEADQAQTFPNDCIAKCAGAVWITGGPCDA